MPDGLNKITDETRRAKKATKKQLTFALIGNPNCGKTTLFNQLTGSRQYVGNWPGVTVEKKEGKLSFNNLDINIIDLPGIYSLSPYSSEEIITRNCLINDKIDLIINIVDATNIERNLYLTTQVMELSKPVIVVLNMTDLLEKKGCSVNYQEFSKLLGAPIIPIAASRGTGINKLLKSSVECINTETTAHFPKIYSEKTDKVLSNIKKVITPYADKIKVNPQWISVKVFENDNLILKKLNLSRGDEEAVENCKKEMLLSKNIDCQMIIADERYKYICAVCQKAVHKNPGSAKMNLTDKIDRVVTNKYLALPIFLSIILLIFYLTFGPIGSFFKDAAAFLINNVLSTSTMSLLTKLCASEWAKSLVVGGIIEGVGAVISFLPQITILFTLLSILEDSGYMARAAFITDRLLRKIGLSGRAFVPLLMGFGCSVPAILGTRILEKDRDKKLTILMVPFMSCSAKMPVYAMFISAFFIKNQPLIIFSIYLLGILVAICTALLFKNTILKGKSATFIMELPEYRLPTFKNLTLHVWERVRDFLVKAGTVLVGATVVIWFLQSFDMSIHLVEDSSKSILALIGTQIAPMFTICGFNDWRATVSLLCGLIAKESVVSSMAILYNTGLDVNISQSIAHSFSPLSAYAFMVFVLLYTPCVAALSAIKKEMRSFSWMALAAVYQVAVAWFLSACVFQFGTLISNLKLWG